MGPKSQLMTDKTNQRYEDTEYKKGKLYTHQLTHAYKRMYVHNMNACEETNLTLVT